MPGRLADALRTGRFAVAAFAIWMDEVRDRGLHERCGILAGVGPIRSLRALELMAGLPGVVIPERLGRRLRGVPTDRVAVEGMAACAETVTARREVPGAHVMAVGYERGVPEILEAAGMSRLAERR